MYTRRRATCLKKAAGVHVNRKSIKSGPGVSKEEKIAARNAARNAANNAYIFVTKNQNYFIPDIQYIDGNEYTVEKTDFQKKFYEVTTKNGEPVFNERKEQLFAIPVRRYVDRQKGALAAAVKQNKLLENQKKEKAFVNSNFHDFHIPLQSNKNQSYLISNSLFNNNDNLNNNQRSNAEELDVLAVKRKMSINNLLN